MEPNKPTLSGSIETDVEDQDDTYVSHERDPFDNVVFDENDGCGNNDFDYAGGD